MYRLKEDTMAELENPLPEQKKMLLLVGTLKEKVTHMTQENILETVVGLLQKAYGDKIAYIHKVIYRKSFVWLLESEEEELPALLFVTALDIQKMSAASVMIESSVLIPVIIWIRRRNKK